jgi:predicted RNA binding protein YcfA (HicA-like mRNA interferase family)
VNAKPALFSGRELVKIFGKMGYEQVSQKGSHIKMRNNATEKVIIIPDHKEVDRWTLKTLLRQVEITEEELNKYS